MFVSERRLLGRGGGERVGEGEVGAEVVVKGQGGGWVEMGRG